MFVLSPAIYLEKTIEHSDAFTTTIVNKLLSNNRHSFVDSSSDTLGKPTAFPNPPRPPTPGEPRRPRPNPVPPRPTVPTPPPSPQNYLLYGIGQHAAILVCRAGPFLCPYPLPPPSPGPRRPGPVRPRPGPDVPTPPPSPRRSNPDWTFSEYSSLLNLVLRCLVLATCPGDASEAHFMMAAENHASTLDTSRRHSNNPVSKPGTAPSNSSQYLSLHVEEPEAPPSPLACCELCDKGPSVRYRKPSKLIVSYDYSAGQSVLTIPA
jgi:hypothetical protein